MNHIKIFLAVLLCRLATFASHILGRGGSSIPGKVALKFVPDILKRIQLPKTVIAVTGSNGKTSTVEMICEVFEKAGKTVAWNKEGSNQIEGVITLVLSNCDNSGTVYNCGINYSATGESHNKVYTGGIAGSLIGTAEKRARLDSCRNTGNLIPYDLTGADASTRALYSQVAGGLIGYGGNVDMDACFSSCTIGNGKRQMYCLAGAIGLVIRPFSVTNSTIWFTGYFNRYNSNNHTNSASVACPPVKFGSTTVSPAPALGKYVITGCAVGAKLYYYNAPNTGTDDYSSKCTSSTTLTSGGSHIVRGFSYANEPPYCETGYVVSGNTSITAAP